MRKLIDTPIDSTTAQEDHGILIARHGKLVLEEYFHGENREAPRATTAPPGKSVASDLFSRPCEAGQPLSTSARVYASDERRPDAGGPRAAQAGAHRQSTC